VRNAQSYAKYRHGRQAQALAPEDADFQEALRAEFTKQPIPLGVEGILAETPPAAIKISAMLAKFRRQTPVKIMAAPSVKCRRVLETFVPVRPRDFKRFAGILGAQAATGLK